LSDCKIYKDERKSSDWLDKLGNEERKLDMLEAKIQEDLDFYKEVAREKGRKEANKKMKKVDKIFTPQKLNPDDAKVVFHPVDFVVFNGMKNGSSGEALKNIILSIAATNIYTSTPTTTTTTTITTIIITFAATTTPRRPFMQVLH
jgi:predicted Holliday junction resolvase-like endonuclease